MNDLTYAFAIESGGTQSLAVVVAIPRVVKDVTILRADDRKVDLPQVVRIRSGGYIRMQHLSRAAPADYRRFSAYITYVRSIGGL